jgi:hypothetical protein
LAKKWYYKKKKRKEKEEAERKEKNYCKKESDYLLSKPWLEIGVQHDLILLENQLPFFILVELYMSACFVDEGQETKEQKEDLKKEASRQFVELSCNYFGCYEKGPKSIIPIGEKVKHFADLLRYLLCPPSMKEYWERIMDEEKESSCTRFWQFCSPKTEQHWNHIKAEWRNKEKGPEQKEEGSGDIRYCATKLVDAGLKFKEVKGGKRLLDIKPPRPGVLGSILCFGRPMEVPQLVIDDYTETLLRNLMALEQCLYPSETYICNYVFLLDHLIDDDKDVDLLVHKKVIHKPAW